MVPAVPAIREIDLIRGEPDQYDARETGIQDCNEYREQLNAVLKRGKIVGEEHPNIAELARPGSSAAS